MKNIVIATDKNVGYYNILEESCKKHNIELVTLGLGQKWTGFHLKFKFWLEYLEELNESEIVMISDAYDVIMLEDAEVILRRFREYNKKVLFCCQKGYLSSLVFSKFKGYVLGSGNIIGEVKYIKEIVKLIYKYESEWERLKNDDQVILGYVMKNECKFFKKYVEIDYNHDFFFVTDADNLFYIPYILNNSIKGLEMRDGRIYNTNNKLPVLIHLAGNINGNKYLNYLGYNTKNINLHGVYKIKQVLNFVVIVLNNNLLNIFIIILFILYFSKLRKLIKISN